MKLSGKSCRRKGHQFERECAAAFRLVFPDAKRHLETRKSDVTGADLENTPGFLIQCKRGRKYAPLSKINEVQIDPLEGGIPVLVTKADNHEALAALPLSDFLRLLRKALKAS
jgi:hypothetical protein